ncbi:Uncharacterized protein TCM_028259 [Theobroma cacao]|uniref:Endonuclease/exonuclease/phosphatase domain-containing protein n=1 Tax=Theobroma cacao TaxID=3641 RepID=A0A061GHF8_THECC|nr:Uncharacterized protein TCM_028259 [Theobroma cacao]
MESTSGKSRINKELIPVPYFLENYFAEMEVHPRVQHKRNSDPVGLSLASEKAMDMREKDGMSDDDSISVIQRRLKSLKLVHKIMLLVVLEPMVEETKAEFFRRKLGYEKVITNNSKKIWIFHSFDISYEVILNHNQCLHVSLSFQWLECPILATFVYVKCTRTERIPLWIVLRSLSVDIRVPWLVGGDFNVILNRAERLYGASPHAGSMDDFAATLLDYGLVDGGFEGNTYTWTNSHVFQRLDRIVYNHQWMGLLPITRV